PSNRPLVCAAFFRCLVVVRRVLAVGLASADGPWIDAAIAHLVTRLWDVGPRWPPHSRSRLQFRDRPRPRGGRLQGHGRTPRDQGAHSNGNKGGRPMTQWTSEQLDKIGKAEEVQIASVRRDGTLRKIGRASCRE